ncbi:MAG: hypothetical protein ACLP3B_13120 [Syntrophobacteraceae bacterium]
MSQKTKNWILTSLRWLTTLGNLAGCFVALGKIISPYFSDDKIMGCLALLLFLLNFILIWSPIREFSNYFSLKMRRRALEEQRKIDELEIVELDHPE